MKNCLLYYDIINKLILYASKKCRIDDSVCKQDNVGGVIASVFNKGVDSMESYLLRLFKDYVSNESFMKEVFMELSD